MTQTETPYVTQAEKFTDVVQACVGVFASHPDAADLWQVFDDLTRAFDGLTEPDALATVAQFMDLPGMQSVTRTLARRLTERSGQNARAHYLYGRSLLIIDRDSPEAGPALERAWKLDPHADPLLPLCRAASFIAQKRYVEAEQACRTMLERAPDNADAYSNLAVALRLQYRPDEAVIAGETALRIAPDHQHAPINLALALIDSQRFEDALSLLRALIVDRPHDDRIRLPLGELELRFGMWESGWANLHARFSLAGLREQLAAREQACGVPHWRGESLEGRTLGVWLEQGYGDAILLIRFLPLIAERVRALGGKLVFGCFGPLVELFRPLIPEDVELNVDFLRATDFHIPLMSCGAPFAFGNATLPGHAYLRADDQQVARWRERMGIGDGRLHVALAWTGNPGQVRNDARSLPMDQLENLLAARDVVFHSVNPSAGEVVAALRERGFDIIDASPDLHDFSATAALLLAADAVVTTCTSVAHLGGAVGARTFLMLDRTGSFVWGTEELRSPWYDSIHIVRQARFGDWRDVVQRVRETLASMQDAPAPAGQIVEDATDPRATPARIARKNKADKASRKAGRSARAHR
ncbi:tetratricopeptide repeat protein [Uliginosibacterium sp. sgz301328]|uniref:tetratricopeptide repeat protein n=1 Tax=Uliginosibacterium sp. sgz301328 TaxID=3243764 RepID=UPI00359EC73A